MVLDGKRELTVVFRADASRDIGTGHVMRCLTIAGALKPFGFKSVFVSRSHPGHMLEYVRSLGYEAYELSCDPEWSGSADLYARWLGTTEEADAEQCLALFQAKRLTPDLVVVDHYGIGEAWETKIGIGTTAKRMVIDDLANRKHQCDLLLDWNLHESMESRYANLVSSGTRLLLGPRYAVFRPEFYELSLTPREPIGIVNRLLVFYGGIDSGNETRKALRAIASGSLSGVRVDVVLGSANPNINQLRAEFGSVKAVRFHVNASNMAEFIASADIGFGAGGVAALERCFLGLPTLTTTIADNQVSPTRALAARGAIEYLGDSIEVTEETLRAAFLRLASDTERRRSMQQRGFGLFRERSVRIGHPLVGAIMEMIYGTAPL